MTQHPRLVGQMTFNSIGWHAALILNRLTVARTLSDHAVSRGFIFPGGGMTKNRGEFVVGESVKMPDVCGLPIFKINEVAIEVSDGEVHIACGMRAFGQIAWQYVVTMTIADYFRARETYSLASEIIGKAAIVAH